MPNDYKAGDKLRNPQTGQVIEFTGSAWVPVQSGGNRTPQQQAGLPDPTMQAEHRLQGIIEGGPEAAAQTRQASAQNLLRSSTAVPRGVGKGMGQTAVDVANLTNAGLRKLLPYGERYIPGRAEFEGLKPQGTGEKVGYYGEKAGEVLYGGAALGKAALGLLPNAKRAGQIFQSVESIIGKAPVDVRGPGEVAQKMFELQNQGGTRVKVVNDFLRRVTDPKKGPLTFEEARNFYSNATRLSANERMNLNPVAKFQVGRFVAELDASLKATATKAGRGKQYIRAMQEYHKASMLGRVRDVVIKHGGKAAAAAVAGAGATAGGVAAYRALR